MKKIAVLILILEIITIINMKKQHSLSINNKSAVI
jgi:hypothetical protein